MNLAKKKTKWVTIVRNGDMIKLGDIKLTVTKDHNKSQLGLTVEAPATTKITKQGQGNGSTSF